MTLSPTSDGILRNRYNMTAPDRLELVTRAITMGADAKAAVKILLNAGIPSPELTILQSLISELAGG